MMSLSVADYKTMYRVIDKDLSEITCLIQTLESGEYAIFRSNLYHQYNQELVRIKTAYDKYRKTAEKFCPIALLAEYEGNKESFLKKYYAAKLKILKHNIDGSCFLCRKESAANYAVVKNAAWIRSENVKKCDSCSVIKQKPGPSARP